MNLLSITTGAICEGNCLDWGQYDHMVISGFMFLMWAVTLCLFIRERKKNINYFKFNKLKGGKKK